MKNRKHLILHVYNFTPQNSEYIEELNRQPTRLGMDNCLSYLEINPKGRVIYYQVGANTSFSGVGRIFFSCNLLGCVCVWGGGGGGELE